MKRLLREWRLRIELANHMVDAYLSERREDYEFMNDSLRRARECKSMLRWLEYEL